MESQNWTVASAANAELAVALETNSRSAAEEVRRAPGSLRDNARQVGLPEMQSHARSRSNLLTFDEERWFSESASEIARRPMLARPSGRRGFSFECRIRLRPVRRPISIFSGSYHSEFRICCSFRRVVRIHMTSGFHRLAVFCAISLRALVRFVRPFLFPGF